MVLGLGCWGEAGCCHLGCMGDGSAFVPDIGGAMGTRGGEAEEGDDDDDSVEKEKEKEKIHRKEQKESNKVWKVYSK